MNVCFMPRYRHYNIIELLHTLMSKTHPFDIYTAILDNKDRLVWDYDLLERKLNFAILLDSISGQNIMGKISMEICQNFQS